MQTADASLTSPLLSAPAIGPIGLLNPDQFSRTGADWRIDLGSSLKFQQSLNGLKIQHLVFIENERYLQLTEINFNFTNSLVSVFLLDKTSRYLLATFIPFKSLQTLLALQIRGHWL